VQRAWIPPKNRSASQQINRINRLQNICTRLFEHIIVSMVSVFTNRSINDRNIGKADKQNNPVSRVDFGLILEKYLKSMHHKPGNIKQVQPNHWRTRASLYYEDNLSSYCM
jgi:hypothetical protein